MSQQGITRLGLSGFQVFSEYVSIPLSRITLLFGPNSSGKSAIEDALKLAARLWAQNDPGWRDDVRSHWRRNSSKEDDYADKMRIEVTCATNLELDESYAMESGRAVTRGHETYFAQEIELTTIVENEPTISASDAMIDALFSFDGSVDKPNNRDAPSHQSKTSFGPPMKGFHPHVAERLARVDGIDLFCRSHYGESFINFSHPWLNNITPLVDFERAAAACPDVFSAYDGCVRLVSLDQFDGLYPDTGPLRHPETFQSEMLGVGREEVPERFADVIPAIREFSLFMGILERLVAVDVFGNYPVDVVSASRRLPTTDELTLSLSIASYSALAYEMDKAHLALLPKTGDPRYLPLAKSFVDSEVPLPPEYAGYASESGEQAHETINHYLSDYLFQERGYQLTYQHLILVSADRMSAMIESAGNGDAVAIRGYASAAIVRIGLNDLDGRSYTFDQVGSGLGYVLPVLAAIAYKNLSVLILQQPELHLHPALQAALGDAFVEASRSRMGNLVIETHSEHLLLRILKRVRQTMRGGTLASELRITPKEVAVLYFNPSIDGTTEVRHLRISDDGDFMDRWPRGFFDERDRELFDE